MKNIRKSKVETCNDIVEYLWVKEPERAAYLIDKIVDIGNNELVKDFWNSLVEYKKHDKFLLCNLKRMSEENKHMRWNMTDYILNIAFWSYLLTSSFRHNYDDMFKIASALGLGALGVDAFNRICHSHKYEDAAVILEGFRIREPELIDIELCFNKVDVKQANNIGDISKKAYQEAHEVWNEHLKKTGVDLTKKDVKWALVSEKLRESLNKTYQEEDELVKKF